MAFISYNSGMMQNLYFIWNLYVYKWSISSWPLSIFLVVKLMLFLNLYDSITSFFYVNFHYLFKIWDWNCSFEEILDIISLMNGKLFFTIILYYCMNAIRIASVNSSCCLTYSIFFHSNLDLLVDIIFIITPLFMILNDACNHVICNSLLFICALSFIQ